MSRAGATVHTSPSPPSFSSHALKSNPHPYLHPPLGVPGPFLGRRDSPLLFSLHVAQPRWCHRRATGMLPEHTTLVIALDHTQLGHHHTPTHFRDCALHKSAWYN